MRIVLDMQPAQSHSRFRGIGRHTMDLAKAIVRNRKEHEILLVLNGMMPETVPLIRDSFAGLLPQRQILVWKAVAPVKASNSANQLRRRVAQYTREAFIQQLEPDFVYVFSMFEGHEDEAVQTIGTFFDDQRVVVSFHDAIPLIQSDIYLEPDRSYKHFYMEQLAETRKACLLMAISESAMQEAVDYFQYPKDRILNISSAVADIFKKKDIAPEDEKPLFRRLAIHRPYILYSGASDERKNHLGLIEAYARLPAHLREDYHLVLAGGMPEIHRNRFEERVKKLGLSANDVIFTGRLTDDEFVLLYNRCHLYVFPSLHEGFGLPVLEAMSCGAAAIGSNTTSIPEVIGWERALFDPHSVDAICHKIQEALTGTDFYQALKQRALEQAALFSWDKSACRIIAALEQEQASHVAARTDVPNAEAPQSRWVRQIAQEVVASAQGSDPACFNLAATAQTLAYNAGSDTRQVLLDISELVQKDARTGIQRVVRSILREWLQNPPAGYQIEPVYATASQGYRYARQYTAAFQGHDAPQGQDDPIDWAHGDIFFALDFQPEVTVVHQQFYQQLRDDGVIVNFLLYDLLSLQMPHYFAPEAEDNFGRWLEVAAAADRLVCISQAVATDAPEWIAPSRLNSPRALDIAWFHLGADVAGSSPSAGLPDGADGVLATLQGRTNFLMVSTLEPRKGHAQVLKAFEQLWREGSDANLILVGKQGWMVDALVRRIRAHAQFGKRLHWLEGISDEYLQEIYAVSTCLIAASYGEGFGLPLIEAAQHRIPIMARDIPVFREIAGHHVSYFDATDARTLATALQQWLGQYQEGKAPLPDAMPWLSWQQSARDLLTIILTDPR